MSIDCSFCNTKQADAFRIIAKQEVAICDQCIELCYDVVSQDRKNELSSDVLFKNISPQIIRDELNKYVISQDSGKIGISVGVYNHYKRIYNNIDNIIQDNKSSESENTSKKKNKQSKKDEELKDTNLDKSNILLIGPSGSGKTLFAETLARFMSVPFVIVDATTLTESGYVGEDVDNIIARLYQASGHDLEQTERGIVYIDEIDKIARKSDGGSISRDISGEGVQQSLLKVIEGAKVSISPNGKKSPSSETIEIDTKNILFICGGAFSNGLKDIISRRINEKSIGFMGKVPTKKDEDYDTIMNHVTFDDLIMFGMIPEFIGRLPVIVTLQTLKEKDLIRILTEPKNAIIKQYQKLFLIDKVRLSFTNGALSQVAKIAIKEQIGARGLRAVIESVLLEKMFDIKKYENSSIKIGKSDVLSKFKHVKLNDDNTSLAQKDNKDKNQQNTDKVIVSNTIKLQK